MKKFLLNWMTILLVALISINIVSCSKEEKEEVHQMDNLLAGNWLYLSEEDMVCYLLILTNNNTFDYQSQIGEKKNNFGGTFTYNESTQQLLLTPTRKTERPIAYHLKSVDNTNLIVADSEGRILIFSKTTDDRFPALDWKEKTPSQLLIGLWQSSDENGRTMQLSFREDNVLTGHFSNNRETRGSAWDEPYEDSFMGTYRVDENTMTLYTKTPLDSYNDWGWIWEPNSKKIIITETTLAMDGYSYKKISDTPTDLCEEAIILGSWKQITPRGYILFTFKADGTCIRHELDSSTWLPYEELDYSFDPTKLIRIGNERWYFNDTSSSNLKLNFTHWWWYNEKITLTKTDEKDALIGGLSTLYSRVALLKHKTWTYEMKEDGFNYKLTLYFNSYDNVQLEEYENNKLTIHYKADFYYDYRNNGIYFKDWWTTGEEQDNPDFLEVVDISENRLSIKVGENVITFINKSDF